MTFWARLLPVFSICAAVVAFAVPQNARAQSGLTEQVSQIYGIPLIQGHLLAPDNPAFAARLVPGAERKRGSNMSPLEKAWATFVQINQYRSGQKSYQESINLIPLVLDTNGVRYVMQLIGARPQTPISDPRQLQQYLQYQADEFHKQKFQSFMRQQYGNTAPVTGSVKVLNIKRVRFGNVDLGLRLMDIQNMTGSRNGRGPLGMAEFENITMPDHELNPEIELRAPDIEGFVRGLENAQGGQNYGNRRERAAILLVAGELSLSPQAVEWRPQALTAYRTLNLSQPIAEITYADIYTDLTAVRQAQMAALQAQAARTQAAVQSTTGQSTEPATVPGNTNARDVAAVTSEFKNRAFDILGLAPGLSEAQSRALLKARYDLGPTEASKRPSASGALSPCDVANNEIELDVSRFAEALQEKNRQAAASDARIKADLTEPQLAAVAAHRARLIASLKPKCRNPLAASFRAKRLHNAGVRDEIIVYLAPDPEGNNNVVALSRTLNWQGVRLNVLGQLEEKLGSRFSELQKGTRFWSKDPARVVAFAANPAAAQACYGQGRWPISNGAFDRRVLPTTCGTIIGATQKGNWAEIYMVDTELLNSTPKAARPVTDRAAPAKIKIDF